MLLDFLFFFAVNMIFICITWSHPYRKCICLHLSSISNSSHDTSGNVSGLERKSDMKIT